MLGFVHVLVYRRLPDKPYARGKSAMSSGWYRPSVGVPRDVGCCALVVFVAYIFSVQFSSAMSSAQSVERSSTGYIISARNGQGENSDRDLASIETSSFYWLLMR